MCAAILHVDNVSLTVCVLTDLTVTTVKIGGLGCAEDHRLYLLTLHGKNNTTLNLQHWEKRLFSIQF